jgi:hypothetical protein
MSEGREGREGGRDGGRKGERYFALSAFLGCTRFHDRGEASKRAASLSIFSS